MTISAKLLNFSLVGGASFIIFSCGTVESEIQNSPNANVSGSAAKVYVLNEDGAKLNGPFVDIIKDETEKFLMQRGYTIVESSVEAFLLLRIQPGIKNREVDVPAQSYAIPMQSGPSTSNFNVYSNNGSSAYGTVTSPGSTTWVPVYTGGYTTTIQDQWLEVHGLAQEYNKWPRPIFRGQVYRETIEYDFFGKESNLRFGLRQLLSKASIKDFSRQPQALGNKNEKPGCGLRTGLLINGKTLREEKRSVVEIIRPDSGAESAGIQVGDEITSFGGHDWADIEVDRELMMRLYQRGSIEVRFNRDGKQKKTTIKPIVECPEM